ncbi:DUF5683 domain-containing protein [Gracilimonas sp.]|uniref:DUF5683 domain-containing protein n=1 Tax=Gracilimonas sp. TaxID=1974203 RepID=UPI0032ECC77F
MTKYLFLFLTLFSTTLYAQNKTGFIKFEFNTDSAYVIPGNDLFEAVKLASGDSLKFTEGTRLLSFQTYFDKSKTQFIKVIGDSTVIYSHTFEKNGLSIAALSDNIAARDYYNANAMILTDEDSEIFFEGNYVGTGFAKFNTFGNIGKLTIKNPDFGISESRLNIPEQKLIFITDKLRPSKSAARFFSVFPGASQFYKRQHVKALLLGASAVTIFAAAALKSANYKEELSLFKEYQNNYENAETEQIALRFGDLAESQQSKVKKLDNQRRGLLLAGILIYGYNIYDAFTSKPAGGYLKKKRDFQFYLSELPISGNIGAAGTLKYNF